ncbi:conserved hypothetical protein [Aeromicrobium sp. 9AM]|nr:conserved hypothetical protein [Aeromicrobium sp. 9AM]
MTPSTTDITTVSSSWGDISSMQGREFTGGWFSVDADRLQPFDFATYTDQNTVALEGSNFPDGLVEGFHLLSLLDHLSNQILYIDDPAWTGWNYGLDRVRFVSPVTVDDVFRIRGTVSEVIPRGDGQLLLLSCWLEVRDRVKPAMTAEWRVLWTLGDGDRA